MIIWNSIQRENLRYAVSYCCTSNKNYFTTLNVEICENFDRNQNTSLNFCPSLSLTLLPEFIKKEGHSLIFFWKQVSQVANLSEVAVCCYQRRHLGGWGRRGAGSPVSWWPALCSGRQRTTYCPPPAALRRPCSVLRVLRAAAAATRRAPTSGGRVSSDQDTAARGLRTAGCWSSDNRTTHRLYLSGTALEKWRFTETCFRWSWFKLGRSMVVIVVRNQSHPPGKLTCGYMIQTMQRKILREAWEWDILHVTCVHHNLEKLSPVFVQARPELPSLQLFLAPPGFCHGWHPATRNMEGWDRKMGTVIGHTNTAVMEAACSAFGNFCFRYRLRITEQITEHDHDHRVYCVNTFNIWHWHQLQKVQKVIFNSHFQSDI